MRPFLFDTYDTIGEYVRHLLPFFLLIAMLSLSATEAVAQRNPPGTECPASQVIASAENVTDGEEVTFHVELWGGNVERSLLRYNWTIDRGRIVSGQGSPVIIVDTTGHGTAGSVIATVDIAPYPDCEWNSSELVRVRRKGKLTKADLFWDWFFQNSSRFSNYDSPYNKNVTETFEDLTQRLSEVDTNLTFKIMPRTQFAQSRKLTIGYAGKSYNAKVVNSFIARAPIMPQWEIVSTNPK